MRSLFRLVVLIACLAPAQAFAQLTFVEIAREFTGGLWLLDPNFRPAIANDGTVVFAGGHAPGAFTATRFFAGDGAALKSFNFGAYNLSAPGQAFINDLGGIAFPATRTAPRGTYRGVYTVTFGKGGVATLATLYEGLNTASPAPGAPRPVRHDIAMSPNGTIGFSSIVNGVGAIYRSPFAGPYEVLRTGTGAYYNTQFLDANDASQVVVQMEYDDLTAPLSRGFLVFETPGQVMPNIDTGLERLSVGNQPVPAMNASGTIAFVSGGNFTMRFFDPPNVYGPVYQDVVVGPGVWTVTPGPMGYPKTPTLIAGPANGYSNITRVDINDSGNVAFQASANGHNGVFTGPDPVADKVLASGDVRGAQLYSVVSLGSINNSGDIALWTSDHNSTDRQVWRVEGAFE